MNFLKKEMIHIFRMNYSKLHVKSNGKFFFLEQILRRIDQGDLCKQV